MISRWAGRKPAGEVLVYMLVSMTALLAVPWIDQAEKRFPFLFPLVLFGAGLLTRFEPGIPHTTPAFWLFARGWAVARARHVMQRCTLSLVAALAIPGFFDNPGREPTVIAPFCWRARPCTSIWCIGWFTRGWLSSAPPSPWWRHWWQARRTGRCAAR